MGIDKDGYWLDCDFVSGACFSYENSLRHIKYSNIAANESDYGFAVSHLILGIEELIKALLLVCCDGNRYFLSTNEKERVFAQHNFKHLNIKQLFTSLSDENIEEYHENPFSTYVLDNSNKFQSTAHFLSKGLSIGTLGENELETLISLLDKANDFKNKGFYVDYRGGWKLPEEIEIDTYTKYKDLTDKLVRFIQPIFTLPITDEGLQSFLDGKWV